MNALSIRFPLYGLRSWFMQWANQKSYPIYSLITGRHQCRWSVSRQDLLAYPPASLGKNLGHFLTENQLELLPGFENHDVFHVLLGIGLSAPEEVVLQCCLIGNGKRSSYALVAGLTGVLFFPEHWTIFHQAYRRGRALRKFHHWHYRHLLRENLTDLRHFLEGGCIRGEGTDIF